ncbi:hypothetical protein SUGI_0034910 [Cryptomeria japonica]|nr:hypothetical protein SUGI_0034910 [Cryptomeria japonica]
MDLVEVSRKMDLFFHTLQLGWLFFMDFNLISKGIDKAKTYAILFHSNPEGHAVVAGYGRIPNGTNDLTKARALLFGVKIAIKNKVKNLIVEEDSQIIITALIESQTPNWQLDYIIQEARELLACLDSYQIMHCYREANRMTDLLANRRCEQEAKRLLFHQGSSTKTKF